MITIFEFLAISVVSILNYVLFKTLLERYKKY
jgi:hypothetical protein